MTEELKQTIKEEVLKLPKEFQQAINGFAWEKIAEDIGKKYSLSESEITTFQAETAIILVGAEDKSSYPENIETNIRKPREIAEKMADEAFEKIFEPIKKRVEETVKANMHQKEMTWKQSVNFILSGGEYSSLINDEYSDHTHDTQKPDSLLGSRSMQDMKDRLIN